MGRPNLIPIPRAGDWESTRRAFQKLNTVLGQESIPVFNGATIEADASIGNDLSVGGDFDIAGTLTLSGLTASQIVATNASKELVSIADLTNWIADVGTGNIVVADDASGGVTLDTVQDILTTSAPTFGDLTLSNPVNIYGLSHDSFADVHQDVNTDASPTFANITDSGLTAGRVTYAGTAGLLTDSANLTFDGTTLTTEKMLLTTGTQNYLFTERSPATSGLVIQGQTSGSDMQLEFFSKDGDGTDNVIFQMFGYGTPSNVSNRKQMQFGYSKGGFFTINSIAGSTALPLVIYTSTNSSQLYLNTNGGVGINCVPTYQLDVNGTFRSAGAAAMTSTLGVTGLSTLTGGVSIPTTEDIQFRDSAITIASLDDGHLDITTDVSVDMNTPLVNLQSELESPKCKLTSIGGYAVRLTNKTGGNTVAGQLVKADTATDDAVILTAASDDECFGVLLDSGIADGSEAWVVVSGIADVAMADNTAATHGNWVETSTEAGYADSTGASPAAAPEHFQEIGHCIETVVAGGAGTHIMARCILHFN